MRLPLAASPAERRLLPEGRLSGPMPWVIAIMMFLMVLSAAGGLGLAQAARALGGALSNRLTVQIVEADPARRERQADAALAALPRLPGVRAAARVDAREMKRLLEPWLGAEVLGGDLPVPVMIDVDLDSASSRDVAAGIAVALRPLAPAAQVDDHGRSLAPLARLIGALKWLAALLVLLMGAATAAAVALAARAALNTHRATIDVMHLLGATDLQIARLFQRRIALDALAGGLVGLGGALLVLLLLGSRVAAVGSELVGSMTLPPVAWVVLLLFPLAGMALAMAAARWTVLAALRRIL